MQFYTVIGLEVHSQLLTRTKMFCGCAAIYGAAVNSRACPVCLGLPGALPTPNRAAVEMAVKMGLAVGSTIARKTKFDRKNYFYADLPKGYQISQYDMPLCAGGSIAIRGQFGEKRIGIIRIHLEEDAGKSIHTDIEGTLVDLNRCGVPLVEIVSAPDIASPQEAYAYLQEIRRLVRWLGICDGNLEEGSLRCDANVSVARVGDEPGIPVEIKNLNSFHGVEKALQYEIERQRTALECGETSERRTLLWDADRQETRLMRSKESAQDYRYFPDPDLVELEITDVLLRQTTDALPELPWTRMQRYLELGVKSDDAEVLVAEKDIADYFEAVLKDLPADVPRAARWVVGEALRWRKELGGGERFVAPAQATIDLARLEAEGRVSTLAAKSIYEEMARTGRSDPEAIMREKGLEQVKDTEALQKVIYSVIARSQQELNRYLGGEAKLKGYFIGQIMKETRGKADPVVSGKLFDEIIAEMKTD